MAKSSVGARVRAARKRRGLSQSDVYRLMVLDGSGACPSQGWLSSLESGASRDAGASKLALLARVLGVPMEELVGEDSPGKPPEQGE